MRDRNIRFPLPTMTHHSLDTASSIAARAALAAVVRVLLVGVVTHAPRIG